MTKDSGRVVVRFQCRLRRESLTRPSFKLKHQCLNHHFLDLLPGRAYSFVALWTYGLASY
jgi:hypothetical protein